MVKNRNILHSKAGPDFGTIKQENMFAEADLEACAFSYMYFCMAVIRSCLLYSISDAFALAVLRFCTSNSFGIETLSSLYIQFLHCIQYRP